MVRLGREVRSWTNFILGIYRRLFRNVAAQDPQHNSDHYMVLGCLRSAPMREHIEYLGRRTRPPPPSVRRPYQRGRTDSLLTYVGQSPSQSHRR